MAEDTESEPALDLEETIIQSLRDHIDKRVDDAREKGKQSGLIEATFHVARLLSELADPMGYKVVLVRKDVTESLEHEPKFSTAKPITKKAKQRKATPNKLSESTPIEELNLQPRARHTLRREGIRTIGDVMRYSNNDLLDLRQFGDKSLADLKVALSAAGYERK